MSRSKTKASKPASCSLVVSNLQNVTCTTFGGVYSPQQYLARRLICWQILSGYENFSILVFSRDICRPTALTTFHAASSSCIVIVTKEHRYSPKEESKKTVHNSLARALLESERAGLAGGQRTSNLAPSRGHLKGGKDGLWKPHE